uniref:mRNA 5'-phosphatase n=1 Tax=Neobodo designis TaxID=312471 RepID=A0A7S1PPN1_NEODS|mmetsp:Transcript_15158/g.47003  ORF Transcript_15158/g.47003 Transcript_15158/m.47003 type:complete len:230 (+) Transcript_15158:32-721(+)
MDHPRAVCTELAQNDDAAKASSSLQTADDVNAISALLLERFKAYLSESDEIEVEARLCTIRGPAKGATCRLVQEKHTVDVGVDRKSFTKVLRYVAERAHDPPVKAKTTDIRDKDVRVTKNHSNGGEVTSVRKIRRAVLDVFVAGSLYDVRFAVSTETPCSPREFPEKKPLEARDKDRTSYCLGNERVDLTTVESRGRVTREVEIEMGKANATDLPHFVENVLRIVEAAG